MCYSLKYKDVHGQYLYYMNIGFKTFEAAERELKILKRKRDNWIKKGYSLEKFIFIGHRIPVCMYQFKIVKR